VGLFAVHIAHGESLLVADRNYIPVVLPSGTAGTLAKVLSSALCGAIHKAELHSVSNHYHHFAQIAAAGSLRRRMTRQGRVEPASLER